MAKTSSRDARLSRYIHSIHHSCAENDNKLNSRFTKGTIYMLFKNTHTVENGNSQSDVSTLDNRFSRMQCESSSYEKQVTDDGLNSRRIME